MTEEQQNKIRKAAEFFEKGLRVLGLDCSSSPDTEDTPIRFSKWISEACQNIDRKPSYTSEALYDSSKQIKLSLFEGQDVDQLVVERNIPFHSLCAHHLLPFSGVAHIGYLPSDKQIGISKLPRILDFYAAKPQSQENLTQEVAHAVQDATKALFVGVVIVASHSCVSVRGVKKHGAETVTSKFLPSSNDSLKAEFMRLAYMKSG